MAATAEVTTSCMAMRQASAMIANTEVSGEDKIWPMEGILKIRERKKRKKHASLSP